MSRRSTPFLSTCRAASGHTDPSQQEEDPLVGSRSDPAPLPPTPSPEKPDVSAPEASASGSSRPSRWAALLARIYEVFPLICPTCQTPLTFIAFAFGELRFPPVLTDPVPITQILAHIGEPTSPLLIHPARGPPQTEFHLDEFHAEERDEEMDPAMAQDGIDQSPEFDPADPEPVPEDDDFDQTRDG